MLKNRQYGPFAWFLLIALFTGFFFLQTFTFHQTSWKYIRGYFHIKQGMAGIYLQCLSFAVFIPLSNFLKLKYIDHFNNI